MKKFRSRRDSKRVNLSAAILNQQYKCGGKCEYRAIHSPSSLRAFFGDKQKNKHNNAGPFCVRALPSPTSVRIDAGASTENLPSYAFRGRPTEEGATRPSPGVSFVLTRYRSGRCAAREGTPGVPRFLFRCDLRERRGEKRNLCVRYEKRGRPCALINSSPFVSDTFRLLAKVNVVTRKNAKFLSWS